MRVSGVGTVGVIGAPVGVGVGVGVGVCVPEEGVGTTVALGNNFGSMMKSGVGGTFRPAWLATARSESA